MALSNEIVLRPRFSLDVKHPNETVLNAFEASKKTQSNFIITRVDDHVFLKIPKKKQHLWSPQLHLEILYATKETSKLKGFFGPNPTLWTLFMFLHFILGVVFLGCLVWGYSNWSLEKPIILQVALSFVTITLWIVLYIFGRMGKTAGNDEMVSLYTFMRDVIQNC